MKKKLLVALTVVFVSSLLLASVAFARPTPAKITDSKSLYIGVPYNGLLNKPMTMTDLSVPRYDDSPIPLILIPSVTDWQEIIAHR